MNFLSQKLNTKAVNMVVKFSQKNLTQHEQKQSKYKLQFTVEHVQTNNIIVV